MGVNFSLYTLCLLEIGKHLLILTLIFYRKDDERKELEKTIQYFREKIDRVTIHIHKMKQGMEYLEDNVADMERQLILLKREFKEQNLDYDSEAEDDYAFTIPGQRNLFFERNGITLERI